MGFGGSRWTKDLALKIIIYAVSVGAKLFVLQLIIGLGQQVFNTLLANYQANSGDLLVSVGAAIVMLALVKIIPDLIQGLISGASMGGAGVLLGSAAGTGRAAWDASWGTVKTAAGTAMVTRGAWNLASEQMQDAQASGQLWRPGRALRMAANAGLSVVDTIGLRLSGRFHYGTGLGQMSEALKERAVDRQAGRIAGNAAGGPPGSVSPGGPGGQPGGTPPSSGPSSGTP